MASYKGHLNLKITHLGCPQSPRQYFGNTSGSLLNQSEPYGNQTDTVSHFGRFQGAEPKTNNDRLDAIVVIPCMKEIDLGL